LDHRLGWAYIGLDTWLGYSVGLMSGQKRRVRN